MEAMLTQDLLVGLGTSFFAAVFTLGGQRLLESYKHKNKLRVVALEKRLEVHQKAYNLWCKMRMDVSSKRGLTFLSTTTTEQSEFLKSNIVYMYPEAVDALGDSIESVNDIMYNGPPPSPFGDRKYETNMKVINEAGDKILKAIKLPPLNNKKFLKSQ